MSLKSHCKCGHEVDSHFDKVGCCLAAYCDCNEYLLYSAPDRPRQEFKAAPQALDEDDVYADDELPDTLPNIPIWHVGNS
jgi:hypothetical protein